jgi:hypothetical protein
VSQHARSNPKPTPPEPTLPVTVQPLPSNIKRWRQYLADERAEAAV